MKSIIKLSFCIALSVSTSVWAEIVTDGSLGANASLSGAMTVPQSLGTTAGSNLFHSFSVFNINTGESASFTGDPALKNVISRVTGGTVSNIDGLLQSTIGNANFYFINPAGVTFGANAQIDVPAAFYVSTANTLRFADGNQFNASNPSASVLSVANPTGFGFLNNQVGNINVQNSWLNFNQKNSVSLTANNVQLDNGWITSSEGSIHVIATGGVASDIPINAPAPNTLKGQVVLNNAWLDTSGDAGGKIHLQGGDVSVDNASWATSTTNGTGKSGNITVKADRLTIANNGYIGADSYGQSNAGTVDITSNTVNMSGYNSAISSDAYAEGSGGNITINAQQTTVDGSSIYSAARTGSTGNAGTVTIKGNNLTLNNKAWIVTDTKAQGNAGNVNVNVAALNITEDSYLSSSTFTAGNAGNVTVNTGSLKIDNQTGKGLAGIIARAEKDSTGKAGTISVQATGTVDVSNGGRINATTLSTGDAGAVSIKANALNIANKAWISADTRNPGTGNAGTVAIEAASTTLDGGWITGDSYGVGNAGGVNIKTAILNVLNSGWISSDTYNTGNAGAITVDSDNVSINGGYVSSDTRSTGNAGNVTISSKTLNVLNNGWISSNTYSTGNAGNVTVNADILRVLANGWISSDTLGRGNAGAISVSSGNTELNGGWISSDTQSAGNAGDVTIKSNHLAMQNGGWISSNAKSGSTGNAGAITVNSNNTDINSSWISSDTHSTGNAGRVFVKSNILNIFNSGWISSDTYDAGNAGDIFITTALLSLDNARIAATAEKDSSGTAGSVHVKASQALTAVNNASINSSTFGSGKAGDVTVQTPTLLLDTGAEISALAGVGSSGETGVLKITTNTATLNNGGKISVQNDGIANNPNLIKPSDLVLDIPYLALNGGIITAATSGNVNAGNVLVKSQNPLALRAKASINSNTSGSGSAGNVSVSAPTITLDDSSISAEASSQSQGQTGNVTVTANQAVYLKNNANISLKNAANIDNPKTIKPSAVTVSAPDIDLKNSSITTESTGNVDAGNININFSHWLTLNPSFITTTANTGNGGNITITGGELINLQDSGFLTSVSGANSNGGNIKVTADYLIMNTGVIQANAVGGSGGDIELKLKALIPSQNRLILGGKKVAWQPFQSGLNVIQAASENGVSGAINVTSPQFDISASISGLDTEKLVMPDIDNSPCQSSAMMDSSLSRAGQGGIPNNEAQYGFIPPAITNTKATSTPATPLAHLSGSSLPCKK